MQCRIDECGADALVPVCGVDGGVVNVSASAVMYPRRPSCPASMAPVMVLSCSLTKQVLGLRLRYLAMPSRESSMVLSPMPVHAIQHACTAS